MIAQVTHPRNTRLLLVHTMYSCNVWKIVPGLSDWELNVELCGLSNIMALLKLSSSSAKSSIIVCANYFNILGKINESTQWYPSAIKSRGLTGLVTTHAPATPHNLPSIACMVEIAKSLSTEDKRTRVVCGRWWQHRTMIMTPQRRVTTSSLIADR